MKEILFRGKRIDNGEWIEGNLLGSDVIIPVGQEFEIEADKIYGCDLIAYLVEPATVILKNSRDNSKNNSLPNDVKSVIINNNNVVVSLKNGKKGVAVQSSEDNFDSFVGFCIAYYKAKNARVFNLKKSLNGCINFAKKKGYKQAILKNYNDFKGETHDFIR